jgi:hypothetical protein
VGNLLFLGKSVGRLEKKTFRPWTAQKLKKFVNSLKLIWAVDLVIWQNSNVQLAT